MVDIIIHVSQRLSKATVHGDSERGRTWIRQNMMIREMEKPPIVISAEMVSDLQANIECEGLEVLVR